MPVRNGTGPQGQGSRTGRGMGNCKSSTANTMQTLTSANNQAAIGSGRGWNNWWKNFLGHGPANRFNRK